MDFASKGKNESALAMEMLERIIVETAEDMLELEREEIFVISSFYDALHQEELAEARKVDAQARENAAAEQVKYIEEFDGDYEVDERKRDLNVVHANEDIEAFERRVQSESVKHENEYLLQEFEIKKQLEELQKKEDTYKADLEAIKDIVREQLRQEWDVTKDEQKI